MNRSIKTILTSAFLAALLVVGVGCSDDDDTIMSPAPNLGAGAQVRVIHASPDAPAVDVYAEGVTAPLITNLAYGGASPYLDLAAGTYNIQLRGAPSTASDPIAYETGDLAIANGDKISAIAVGLLATSTGPDDAFRVLRMDENFSDPGTGNAAVRIVHGSADAPTVAIDVNDDASDEVPNFARFADTGEAGVPLPSGTALQIAIRAGNPLARVTAFTTPQLPEGAELFVIATGLLGKLPRETDGFSLLAIGPSGAIGFIKQNPVVFALHASPDAPAVDIYAGSAKLIENLAFGEISSDVQVPPGAYDLDFHAYQSPTSEGTLTTPSLAAGEFYLAIASGYLSSGSPAFRLLPYGDAFGDAGAGALVRVVHASPDAPPVDVGTVSGNVVTAVPDYVNLAFEDASVAAGTALPAAALNIGVAATGSTDPLVTFDVTTIAGLKAFAVAAGSYSGPGESFRLIIVNATSYPWTAAEVAPNE